VAVDYDIRRGDGWFIGEDKVLRFTVYASSATKAQIADGSGAKENITGWAIEFVLRADLLATNPVFTKTVASGITITDGPGGVLTVAILDTNTNTLAGGEYYYVLRRTDADLETVLASGKAVLRVPASY
jgi:hypothetical protein